MAEFNEYVVKNSLSKKTTNTLLITACLFVAAWSATVIYTVAAIYFGGVYADEHGLPGGLGTHEISAIITMLILFVLAVWSYNLWRINAPQMTVYARRLKLAMLIVGCALAIPFTLTLLFFILNLFFVILR